MNDALDDRLRRLAAALTEEAPAPPPAPSPRANDAHPAVVLLAAAVATLLVLGTPLLLVSRERSRPPIGGSDPAAAPPRLDGRWVRAPDLPIAPRTGAFADLLSDGRLVLLAGVGSDAAFVDGAVLDRAGTTWQEIPPPPVSLPRLDSEPGIPVVARTGDRLLALSLLDAAVWDLGERS